MPEEKSFREIMQHLDEAQKKLDLLRKKLERLERKWKQGRSPPYTMSVPEDFNRGPHMPGLG